ncbi:alkaline serine protease [Grosmannia clavigera kw1407]|uniref:tripeptidyl-peptidase II n=1 Tax=Grosmannia clavigera (strain kw1407 / UAMH 11150) TaxID=655863 RepID=F0XTY4_GROCL|nr:alkaline serine protease [Grosmannia clavigera kw1407]EFW98614.1 alkaline serine protease [Grosmannia clavigera kw1407]
MLPKALMLAAAAGLSLASPVRRREVPSTHQLHERHAEHWSSAWTKRSKVSSGKVLPMRIGLTQSNLGAGHDRLMEISTPGSALYGKHMSAEEVADFFAPAPSAVSAVHEWLTGHGIAAERIGQSANKQWLQFDATVEEAEDLLLAEFFMWEHTETGAHDISTEEYHLPERIREHVDYVTPGVRLRTKREARMQEVQKRSAYDNHPRPDIVKLPGFPHPNSSTCSLYVTKECTQNQYKIPNATLAAEGNQIGIYESLDVHYSRADLDVYFSHLYPHIPNGTYPEERLIDGAIGAIEDTTEFVPSELEAPLDFDSAWPLIYPQGAVLFQDNDEYYESTNDYNGFWNTFLDAIDGSYCTYSAYGETGDCTEEACRDPSYPDLNPGGYTGQLQCGVYKPTNVISISYGATEAQLPDYYLKRQCNEWMKLGLQGTTVVMSSGDSGVGGKVCNGDSGKIFDPSFAATCPYVLAVGSTEWDRQANATGKEQPYEPLTEVATARFASGGGFSNVFGIPDYQRDAVSAYFDQVESSLPFQGYHHYVSDGNFSSVTGGLYHHGGRAFPDVAAVGDRQVVYSNGSWWLVGGTSLAAPVFAAVLNLVNEERIADGKSTLGFIHPILYQHPEVFTDITVGSNPGCNTTGFPTAKGWDPVTGLGSPIFPKLLEVLSSA